MADTRVCSKNNSDLVAKCLENVDTPVKIETAGKVQVRFIIKSKYSFCTVFENKQTVGEIKERLADVLDIDETEIGLKWRDIELDTSKRLDELMENPLAPVEIELSYFDLHLLLEKYKKNIPSLEVITVHPQFGKLANITVSIENTSSNKKWFGGYRSKLNGKEYHHAEAQTTKKDSRLGEPVQQFHRDTQTVELKTKEISTTTSKGTQMARHDHYIASSNDKIILVKHYISEDQKKKYDIMARIIQSYWRKLCILQALFRISTDLKQIKKMKKEVKDEAAIEHSNVERVILSGAAYPSKRDNFSWLHLCLQKWTRTNLDAEEPKRIEPSRKAIKSMMLNKEIKCLFGIDKLKIQHKKEALNKLDIRYLEKTACPKTFKNKSGNLVVIDDLETQRARDLKEIYSELKKEAKNSDRIAFLLQFRKLFDEKFNTYEYAIEIVSLVDREISLIIMGMKGKSLRSLRKRIEQLYMNFTKQEEFNPKAAKYKPPNMPLTVVGEYLCTRCRRQFPASKFPVHFRMTDYSVCTSCQWMYETDHINPDPAPYKRLLMQIRQDEMDKCSTSAICFLMQPQGMAYLTAKIWHNHSALSECSIMNKLRHVRWVSDMEWSPWNTILLTKEEALFHSSIPDVHNFYHPNYIMVIQQRHIRARNFFFELQKVNISLCESGEWYSNKINDFYFEKRYGEEFVCKDGGAEGF